MVKERVQSRLAAILAADVVGYSRLIGEDCVSGPVSRVRSRPNDNTDAVREACRGLSEDLGPNARKLRDLGTLKPVPETFSNPDQRRDEVWFA